MNETKMTQKYSKKIQLILLAILTLPLFFGLLDPFNALAFNDCVATINSFELQPTTVAKTDRSVGIYGKITASGGCASTARVRVYAAYNSGIATDTGSKIFERDNISLSGGVINMAGGGSWTADLTKIPNFSSRTQVNYALEVFIKAQSVDDNNGNANTRNWGKILTISATGSASPTSPTSPTSPSSPTQPSYITSGQPYVSLTPGPKDGYYEKDARINIYAVNLPQELGTTQCGQGQNRNYRMKIMLNGKATTFFCFPYPFIVEDNAIEGNINMTGGSNTIELDIRDSDGNYIILQNNPVVFKVGQAPSNSNPANPGPTGPAISVNPNTGQENVNCDVPNPDPRYCLHNPLPVDGLTDMVLLIMRGFTMVVAIWAALFIVIGGFKMVIAAGNEEAIGAARKTITWAVIGLIVAMMAFSIVAIVQNFIGARAPGIQVNNPQGTPNR